MAISRSLLLCGALTLAGYGGGIVNSWVNPGNWFGNSRGQALETSGPLNPLIPKAKAFKRPTAKYSGSAVDQIKALRIERKPGGAIIHVVGVADSIDSYDVRLRSDNEEGPVRGVLSFTLTAERSATMIRGGSEAADQIVAARLASDQELEGIHTIIIKGTQNQRSTHRR